jgi:K+ transporter
MSLETARDIAIIIVALESMVLLVIGIIIGWQVYRLVRFLMSRMDEFSLLGRGLLESAQQTANTASSTATSVKGSADFVADTVVSPVVQVVSAVAGARGFVSALFRLSSSRGKGDRR